MRIGGSTLGIRRAVTVTKCPNKINPCATATRLENEPDPRSKSYQLWARTSQGTSQLWRRKGGCPN